MKIIHLADVHLDSKLNSHLSIEKAKQRKSEILVSFGKVVDYAKENGVKVVIIAGDLFDSNKALKSTEKFICDKLLSASDIDFIYIKGNHDDNLEFSIEMPENLKQVDNGFNRFDYDNVSIGTVGLNDDNYLKIDFEKDNYNIAVMHGTLSNSSDEFYINPKLLQNRNIDYLALGHIHKSDEGKLDDRAKFRYSGCLDGRGFDECGEKGFFVLDTDVGTNEFVPMSTRIIYEFKIDVSDLNSTSLIIEKIKEITKDISSSNLVRIVLEGKTVEDEIEENLIKSSFDDKFFCFNLKNETTVFYDYESYKNDISLKGEFMRLMEVEELEENIRQKAISVVMSALNSEDLKIWE